MTDIKRINEQEAAFVTGGNGKWEDKYTPEERERSQALRKQTFEAIKKAILEGKNPDGKKALEEHQAFLAEMERKYGA